MMYACILTLVVAAYLVAAEPEDLEIEPAKEIHANIVRESWELFKANQNKEYVSAEEEAYRLSVFTENLKEIEIHNQKYKKGETSYWLGVNDFSDLTAEEFNAIHGGCVMMEVNLTDATSSTVLPPLNVILPDTVDWREKGYVTPVKNQRCRGSCWAFSATGSLEGQIFKKTGRLFSLSEQQLVDCSSKFGNKGCKGGSTNQAFKYIRRYGIESEESYPYKAKVGRCKRKSSKVVAKNSGYVKIKRGSESDLQRAVATIGPISVAIDARHSSFRHYSGGVYKVDKCSTRVLNHAVLVVGYGTEDGEEYWLVKNSWGKRWGDNGYIKMARNKRNMCGIATTSSYPLVTKPER